MLLEQELDWDYLLQIAFQRNVAPLLYWSLNTTCLGVPKHVLNQLQNYFQANAQRNLLLTRELLKLLALCEQQEILALPYKGPVLATHVYGNLSLRQFSDLDILVHPRDITRAKDLLLSQGYQPLIELSGAERMLHFQSSAYNHKFFVRKDGRIDFLELHWRVTPPYFICPFELESSWERLETLSLAGVTVLSFPVEDLLLILCIHGSKDHWQKLGWICDVAELIRAQPGLNWDQVTARARKLGYERMLSLGLLLAHDLLDTVLPKEIIKSKIQNDSTAKSLAQQICEQLFSLDAGPLSGIEKHLYYLRLREKWRDKGSYLLYQTRGKVRPNIKDRAVFSLPSGLSFLYYPLRPIRLVREYSLSILKELGRFL